MLHPLTAGQPPIKSHTSGNKDPLHLNKQGIKLFASRLKYSLRSYHDMPSAAKSQEGPAPTPRGKVPLRGEGYVLRGHVGRPLHNAYPVNIYNVIR